MMYWGLKTDIMIMFATANTLTELFSAAYNLAMSMNAYLAKIQDFHSRVQDHTNRDPDLNISDKIFLSNVDQ